MPLNKIYCTCASFQKGKRCWHPLRHQLGMHLVHQFQNTDMIPYSSISKVVGMILAVYEPDEILSLTLEETKSIADEAIELLSAC